MKKLLVSLLIITMLTATIGTIPAAAETKTPGVEVISASPTKGVHEKITTDNQEEKGIKVKKIKGSKGIYSDESKNEYYLQVTEDKFQKVGKLDLDMANNKDMDKLLSSNISKETKDEIIESARYSNENKLSIGEISVFSPMLLIDNSQLAEQTSNTNQAAMAALSSFYYTGYGGYTYKQESIFYTNKRTAQASKLFNTKTEANNFAIAQATYWADFIVGSIPTYGTIYTMFDYFGSFFSNPAITEWSGTYAYVEINEVSRETRLCYIRQDLGSGLQDYLKAKSSFADMVWYERLQPQGYPTVPLEEVKWESYTGAYFNSLDQKAYAYRTGSLTYDERMRSMKDSRTGYTFMLAN